MSKFPIAILEGGPGSGHHGHRGLKGVWGGSSPGGGKKGAYWDKFTGDDFFKDTTKTPVPDTKVPEVYPYGLPLPNAKELKIRRKIVHQHFGKDFKIKEAYFETSLPGWIFELEGNPKDMPAAFLKLRKSIKELDRTAYDYGTVFPRDKFGLVRRVWNGDKVMFDLTTSPGSASLSVGFMWHPDMRKGTYKGKY
jgi:hypothetical protein